MYTIGELSAAPASRCPRSAVHTPPPDRPRPQPTPLAQPTRSACLHPRPRVGFDLPAIRQLIELSAHPEKPCADADAIAASRLGEVRDRIARLRRLETELERMTGSHAHGTAGDCYVLRSLADHDLCGGEH